MLFGIIVERVVCELADRTICLVPARVVVVTSYTTDERFPTMERFAPFWAASKYIALPDGSTFIWDKELLVHNGITQHMLEGAESLENVKLWVASQVKRHSVLPPPCVVLHTKSDAEILGLKENDDNYHLVVLDTVFFHLDEGLRLAIPL